MANEDVEKEKRELELQRQKRFSGGPGSQFISGGEQASDFKGTMSRLLQLLKPQLPLILMTFVMTIAYTVASTYAPNKLAAIICPDGGMQPDSAVYHDRRIAESGLRYAQGH